VEVDYGEWRMNEGEVGAPPWCGRPAPMGSHPSPIKGGVELLSSHTLAIASSSSLLVA